MSSREGQTLGLDSGVGPSFPWACEQASPWGREEAVTLTEGRVHLYGGERFGVCSVSVDRGWVGTNMVGRPGDRVS